MTLITPIPFNKLSEAGRECEYLKDAIERQHISGDGYYTRCCHDWLEKTLSCKKSLLTTSCTHALEMSSILVKIEKGDEVILPSFTFVSSANAFALSGAKLVFIDIRPDTMNIDENLIEKAITPRTKLIVPVHYAGISCEMDKICELAEKYRLYVIEDAAHGILAKYDNKYLGTMGHLGCFSFHQTKNITCGEGGAIIVNHPEFLDRSEIIREKGTNRSKFSRGQVDKYTWVDLGSSYLPSDLNAAFLFGQLEKAEEIIKTRLTSWNIYFNGLQELARNGYLELPHLPKRCEHNGHLFYIKVKNLQERTELISCLNKNNIFSAFHYIPLHSAEAGRRFGMFHGIDKHTTRESERLLRLPMYNSILEHEQYRVIDNIYRFFKK